jgi:Phosphotransferase enzyme family
MAPERTSWIRALGSTGSRAIEIPVGPAGLPEDACIPALAALASPGVAGVLAGLGVSGPGDDVAVLKYHAAERCTFFVPTASGGVAVKAYTSDPAPVVAILRELERRGLASGLAPTAAPLVAWDPALRLVVTRWFDAPSAVELIATGAGGRAGELAAAWLRRSSVQRRPTSSGFGAGAAVRRARSRARIIGRIDPRLGSAAEAVAGALAERRPTDGAMTLTHGSLYAAHVFDLGTGPGVIDCDLARIAPPEADGGMFEATVTRLSLDPVLADEAAAAIARFRADTAGLLDRRALSWHRAAALLTLARRIAGRVEGSWRADTAALIGEAAAVLAPTQSKRNV